MVQFCECTIENCISNSHDLHKSCSRQIAKKRQPTGKCVGCLYQVLDPWCLKVTNSGSRALPGLERFRDNLVLGLETSPSDPRGRAQKRKMQHLSKHSKPDDCALKHPVQTVTASHRSASGLDHGGLTPSDSMPTLVGSTPALNPGPANALIIHHLWVNVAQQADVAMSSVHLACLKSWSPHRQWLWTYCTSGGADFHAIAPGLEVRDAKEIMHPGVVLSLLTGQVPIQIVKDIFSMKVLAMHGGVWADLDMYWLGRHIPLHESGYAFALEPHSRPASSYFGRAHDRITLALFAMPKGAGLGEKCHTEWLGKWMKWAYKNYDDAVPLIDWNATAVQTLWMQNTTRLTTLVMAMKEELGFNILHMPLILAPLSMKLSCQDWQMLLSQPATPGLASNFVMDYNQAYRSPSVQDMMLHTCTVNLWSRQWKADVTEHVLAKLPELRDLNLKNTLQPGPNHLLNPNSMDMLAVVNYIEALSPDVLAALGFVYGHNLLSLTHHMATKHWVKAAVHNNGRDIKPKRPGEGGLPKMVFGTGPWLGPDIHPKVFSAMLLYLNLHIFNRDHDCEWPDNVHAHDGTFVPGPGPLKSQIARLNEFLLCMHKALPKDGRWGREPVGVADVWPWFLMLWKEPNLM